MKKQLGNSSVLFVFFLSLLIGCSSAVPVPDGTGSGVSQEEHKLGGSQGGPLDIGGGAGPAGAPQSAGSAPSNLASGFDLAGTAIGNATNSFQNAGTQFSPEQLGNIGDIKKEVFDLADFYKRLKVGSTPPEVEKWLKEREEFYAHLRDLAKKAAELHLQWLADIAKEIGNRVDVMRFFNFAARKSAFVAKPGDMGQLLLLAASSGYVFTGIAMQIWREPTNVAGVAANVAMNQCYSPAWQVFFPTTDPTCVGNIKLGTIGYISATESEKAQAAVYFLANFYAKDVVITRSVKEAIALMHGFNYKYIGKLGYTL